jgi:hypothetical protein
MGNYYDEVLEEIRGLLKEGKTTEAKVICDRELSMPYIPPETEKELRKLKKDISYAASEKAGTKVDAPDTILERLKGDAQSQLSAAAAVGSLNLNQYLDEIHAYLEGNPFPEAAALIIEAIAEQEIGDEFTYHKDGAEYDFWGDAVTPAAEGAGFRRALKDLQEWLANENPDLYEMAKTLLVHEVYMFLPLSYEEEEGDMLAEAMLKQVSEMMDDGAVYAEVMERRRRIASMN